ncbi:hypothetical protein MMC30_006520 [Trapelia coarctata]|nr:hypothetical protein [Trapelia coarctata]
MAATGELQPFAAATMALDEMFVDEERFVQEEMFLDEEYQYQHRWVAERIGWKSVGADALEEDFGGISDWDMRDSSDEENQDTPESDTEIVMAPVGDDESDEGESEETDGLEDEVDPYIPAMGPSAPFEEQPIAQLWLLEELDAADTEPSHQEFPSQSLRDAFLAACPKNELKEITDFLQAPASLSSNSLDEEFFKFAHMEHALTGKKIEHLVRPSGYLDCKLGIRLHYPTYSTSNVSNGETADLSSPCPRLLLKKGLSSEHALWFESYFRREVAARDRNQGTSPMNAWPESYRQLHEQFSLWCEQHSQMKVLIVCGKPSGEEYLRTRSISRTFTIPLAKDIFVKACTVRCLGRIARIVIFAPHPEWLYHNWTARDGKLYDSCINIAVALAGIEGLDADYFERRGRYHSDTGLDEVTNQPAKGWYGILRVVADELANEKATGIKLSYHQLPGSIFAWMDRELGSSSETTAATLTSEGTSIVHGIFRHISSKASILGGQAIVKKWKESGYAERKARAVIQRGNSANLLVRSIETRPDSPLEIYCANCKSESSRQMDVSPTFGTMARIDGMYIARRTYSCLTPICNVIPEGRKTKSSTIPSRQATHLVPVDPLIPYIKDTSLYAIKN